MHPLTTQRPTVAEIDLADLSFNFHSVREFVGRDIAYMAVVKANAYGHGAIECARQLEKDGVDWFGVAIPEEGVELRNAGITKPILSLGSFWHGQEELLLRHNITPVIYRLENAESLDKFAGQQGRKLSVHVKVDTGMGRIGVQFSEITAFAEKLKSFPNLQVEGIMTHFAAADDLCQNEFTDRQISELQTAAGIFRAKGFTPIYVDMANSPGAIAHPGSLGNMVRLGGVLYGLGRRRPSAEYRKTRTQACAVANDTGRPYKKSSIGHQSRLRANVRYGTRIDDRDAADRLFRRHSAFALQPRPSADRWSLRPHRWPDINGLDDRRCH